jgi:branched-chain amino acid transport system substrate-binding protein
MIRKAMRKGFATAALTAALLAAAMVTASAEDKAPIKFGAAEDFTKVYTFVTIEYSQGQRDYLALVNARGGINGHRVDYLLDDTGNEPQRGIEAYERFKSEGAVMVDFLSTPVSKAVVPRALTDGINVMSLFHGRTDAADGGVFPTVFPMAASYWSQATVLIKYIDDQAHGDLKGKKIALVAIDSPFGREPVPVFQEMAKRLGFEFQHFPYPSPGNEQSAVWSSVRRFAPDWTVIWGAGAGQAVSLQTALSNGMDMDHILSVIWLSETDRDIVGPDQTKGVLKFEGVKSGADIPVIQAIKAEVIDKHQGAGAPEKVGSTYYNVGVASMALFVEGARIALEKDGEPLTASKLKTGLESIKDFTADGLLPPTTITPTDHQGGGRGRVSQWDGAKWVPKSDWAAAYQDVVWDLIRTSAAGFKTSGK